MTEVTFAKLTGPLETTEVTVAELLAQREEMAVAEWQVASAWFVADNVDA
jgi:hypothetical protein